MGGGKINVGEFLRAGDASPDIYVRLWLWTGSCRSAGFRRGPGRPRAQRLQYSLTDMNPTQRSLFDLFGVDRYAPTANRPG